MAKQPSFSLWLAFIVVALIALPLKLLLPTPAESAPSPHDFLPVREAHVDHSSLINGPFNTPQEVTQRCLECHAEQANHVMQSSHWTWEHDAVKVKGRDAPVVSGKKHVINNFCIGIAGNWEGCSSCHAGYGWKDQNFDFSNRQNIDCLVCHEQSGAYIKGPAGMPVAGSDLVAAAKSVAFPKRSNCGSCHFKGGGGDAVKHGDMDTSLSFPPEDVDVHMGRYDMVCTDCHQTQHHQISGRSMTVSVDNNNQIACTDCHSTTLHKDARITKHLNTVACQTCHIPEVATREATKTHWDWSAAGSDTLTEDPKHYLKKKGAFEYAHNLMPRYFWYNGKANRYLYGDPINTEGTTDLNFPQGTIHDNTAKIFPFKVHTAVQVYDKQYNHLLQPKTVGKTGYWTTFDWDSAIRQGSSAIRLAYSGEYGFTETTMHWPQTHMVQPAENALQCRDCHNETVNSQKGRLDWQALGYPGDPIRWGSRQQEEEKGEEEGEEK